MNDYSYRPGFAVCAMWSMLVAPTALAQVVPDRVDPALVTRSLPPAATDDAAAREPVAHQPTAVVNPSVPAIASDIVAHAIAVRGNHLLTDGMFEAATRPYLDRRLSQEDLRALAGAVAGVARAQGLVLATAAVERQDLAQGRLVVTLDEGRIDAVRSIGASSPAADRILARLITHRATTRTDLERTLLLVGDLPGVRIKSTSYTRENGFGILLVTLTSTRVTGYLEFDNRGTREIGRVRSVGLANVHGLLASNDDLGIAAALTPFQPREFTFVSARYATPVGSGGGAASLSGFYGRTRAGGDLSDYALTGNSYGFGVGYSIPVERSRRRSLWFDVDLHTLVSDQSVLGRRFRDDHLTVLSGTVRGAGEVAGGLLHVSVQGDAGLPVLNATKEGDPLASRPDGDARYVAGIFQADWTRAVAGPLSLAITGVAQVATRPLLATAEISIGGASFGRAYDYSERTGDEGVMGSAELRLDVKRFGIMPLQRLQVYAFGDGGTVTNLRAGYGGGALASGGVGLRAGHGLLDGSFEVAVPFTVRRLDTGNRAARLSAMIALHF